MLWYNALLKRLSLLQKLLKVNLQKVEKLPRPQKVNHVVLNTKWVKRILNKKLEDIFHLTNFHHFGEWLMRSLLDWKKLVEWQEMWNAKKINWPKFLTNITFQKIGFTGTRQAEQLLGSWEHSSGSLLCIFVINMTRIIEFLMNILMMMRSNLLKIIKK